MKFVKITSILLMFGFLFVANAVVPVTTLNDNSTEMNDTIVDLNDNSTNANATVIDLPKGRSVISGDINISKLSDTIHSVWIVDGGNWKGYSPHQLVREEISQFYSLLTDNISATKATIVFALEDTQIEITIPSEPEDVTRIYPRGLSLHGANGEALSPHDIECAQYTLDGIATNYKLAVAIKLMGDQASVFVPEKMAESYENFMDIYEHEGYYVQCDKVEE